MRKLSKDELLTIAQKYNKEFTSISNWKSFAKQNKLPHYQTYISHFGSWNEVKRLLNMKLLEQHRPSKYTQEELINILKTHSKAYVSINAWNQYAKVNKLPTHGVFERTLGIDCLEQYTPYTQIRDIVDFHKLIKELFPYHPPTVKEWSKKANLYNYPSSITLIRKYGSWNTMKKEIYK